MFRVSVLCLFSVVFAHPYDSSRYYADWFAAPDQFSGSQPYLHLQAQDEGSSRYARSIEYPLEMETNQAIPQVAYPTPDQFQSSQPYLTSQVQDEGSSRSARAVEYSVEIENNQGIPQVAYPTPQFQSYSRSQAEDEESSRPPRAVEYPSEMENNQAVPQVAYIELDVNAVRNARSLVSGESLNSNVQYESGPHEQVFGNLGRFDGQLPQIPSVYLTSPRAEQSSQNYKSFSFDNLPYVSKMDTPAVNLPSPSVNSLASEFKSSSFEGNLNDYVKELIEPSIKPTTDSKQPRMFGFYYMNIQRYPAKQLLDESETVQTFHKNKDIEELNREQMNDDEILRYLQQILQQQISKFVQHQKQEHQLYHELAQPQNTIKEITTEESFGKKLDQLGNEEKKFLIERLHREEHWLEDSLKHVRDFLNDLQTDASDVTSSSATPAVASNLSNDDVVDHVTSTGSGNSSSEPTTVSPVESITAAFNEASSNKETA